MSLSRLAVFFSLSVPVFAANVVVDGSKSAGQIRALHGGSDGPIQSGGLVDLSAGYRELGIPLTRLHDCRWPNGDVVDMHVVFPDANADPAAPSSYDFARTDACIDAVLKTGSRIVYRLGESIEHTPRQYHVNPPADNQRWASQCIGVIRHYNEGWAGGARVGIVYWEIWNEPENRPRCWTGSDDEYLRLYAAASRAIKARWPALKVGGPGLGYTGKIVNGRFEPGEFLLKFLSRCREDGLPLDFFSWHLYGNDPAEYLIRSRGIRALLDRLGFNKTELHLNEWNYLPDNQWLALDLTTQGAARERYFARITGPEGAAFSAAVLMTLQDAPVDAANYFATNTQPMGLFSEHGTPRKTFYAFKAFRALLDTPAMLPTRSDSRRLYICAGANADRSRIGVLLCNLDTADGKVHLTLDAVPWRGDSTCDVFMVGANHDFDRTTTLALDRGKRDLDLVLEAPATCLLVLKASAPASAP